MKNSKLTVEKGRTSKSLTTRLRGSKRPVFLFVGASLAFLAGCQKAPLDASKIERIQTDAGEMVSMNQSALDEQTASGNIVRPSDPRAVEFLQALAIQVPSTTDDASTDADEETSGDSETEPTTPRDSLLLGFPRAMIGVEHVFGATVTKVSDAKSEQLGNLKLSNLPPIHVKPQILQEEGDFSFALRGCPANCESDTAEITLINIPISGVDPEAETIVVDLSLIGSSFNLVAMTDPTGSRTQLKTKESKVDHFDYGDKTLVFDVLAKMIPLEAELEDPEVMVREFVTRWYLKPQPLNSTTFIARKPVDGVGFFTTQRAKEARIARHPVTPGKHIQYFVKDVPSEYQKGFRLAFADWNRIFEHQVGEALFDVTFLNPGDVGYDDVLAGDIRFNVIQWDLKNVADYNALGPMVSHQLTGEILSANVLVQGPAMLQNYRTWFIANNFSDTLRSLGLDNFADRAQNFARNSFKRPNKKPVTFELSLGKNAFIIPAQQDELKEEWPEPTIGFANADVDFNAFMNGVFRATISHELGHNLGLRHNFRGSLGGKIDQGQSVSNSIMDYLNQSLRFRDRVNAYDEMAVAYGYLGQAPTRTDLFCTDDQVVSFTKPENSAECSRRDATSDPFGYFQNEITRIKDLLVAKDSENAPTVDVEAVGTALYTAIEGLALYVVSADNTMDKWTNFASDDRPDNSADLKVYVRDLFKSELCNIDYFKEAFALKTTEEARKKALDNARMYLNLTAGLLVQNEVYSIDELRCAPAEPEESEEPAEEEDEVDEGA